MKNNFEINKRILEYCPNYDDIINAEFYEDDHITKKMIKIYEDFVFSGDINNLDYVEKLKKLDNVVSKYLKDYHFRSELQKGLTEIKVTNRVKDILDFIVSQIINIFNSYVEGYTRKIYVSRWI